MDRPGFRASDSPNVDARIKIALDLMQRASSTEFSLGSICRLVNLSPTRLRQLFKEETGRTPRQYLRDLRMGKAEQFLCSTFLTVKEISFLCGVKDVSHFVRDFKKQFGLTPSEFRARNRQSERNS